MRGLGEGLAFILVLWFVFCGGYKRVNKIVDLYSEKSKLEVQSLKGCGIKKGF